MELDRNRLVKFLNMTDSQHDAEVLIAIRKSNELLRLHQVKWIDLLGPRSRAPLTPPGSRAREFNEQHVRNEFSKHVQGRQGGSGWFRLIVCLVVLGLVGVAWLMFGVGIFDSLRMDIIDMFDPIRKDLQLMLRG